MRRLGIRGSIVLLLFSIGGFVLTLFLNMEVFSGYDAYGEVPIPGSQTVHLPQGQVTVSFHTKVANTQGGFTVGGNDLPIPHLQLTIAPPAGVAEPTLTEHSSATTTDGDDAHQQVWVAQIPQTGDYTVSTDGEVGGFISPRLAFGHTSPFGYLPWVFVGVFVLALLMLIVSMRLGRRPAQAAQPLMTPPPFAAPQPFQTPTPPDPRMNEGVRIELLKTLTNLHASGGLTDEEFADQKRRILGGGQ
ncbi:SHOCT domain-containing protein [Mycobacterium sp. 1245805.9]|uniref:SHOCT domain-containing protein n=1 Tax=Mycobacterium sp. 1245805.9 TaxID=1856862 RepID=UPI0007FC099B|nr:SHOCT domain-containing protein [Mycobacterium sp. 1245805.9]OBI90225.1 hypothetical protein A9X00_19605 [Mycobacterium sp. 1245805.9]